MQGWKLDGADVIEHVKLLTFACRIIKFRDGIYRIHGMSAIGACFDTDWAIRCFYVCIYTEYLLRLAQQKLDMIAWSGIAIP